MASKTSTSTDDKYKLDSEELLIVSTLHGNGVEVTSDPRLFGTNKDFSSIAEELKQQGTPIPEDAQYPQKKRITRPFHVLVTEIEIDEKIHLLLDVPCFESYLKNTLRLRGKIAVPIQSYEKVGHADWEGETTYGPHEIMINGQTFGPHDMNFNETLSSELLNLEFGVNKDFGLFVAVTTEDEPGDEDDSSDNSDDDSDDDSDEDDEPILRRIRKKIALEHFQDIFQEQTTQGGNLLKDQRIDSVIGRLYTRFRDIANSEDPKIYFEGNYKTPGTKEYVIIKPEQVEKFVYGAISCSAMGISKDRSKLVPLVPEVQDMKKSIFNERIARRRARRDSTWLWLNSFLTMSLRCIIFHLGHKNFSQKSDACQVTPAQVYSQWKERVVLDSDTSLEASFNSPICAMDPEERKELYIPFSIIVNHIDLWQKMHNIVFNKKDPEENKMMIGVNGTVNLINIPTKFLQQYEQRWGMFMEIVASKLRLDPGILSPRWLLRFLTHQFTHIPTDEGNPQEIHVIDESKGFLQLQPSQIMGGVMPNIENRDFKETFEKLLKGSKALIYGADGNELFERGKLSRTIKKERKGKKKQAQVDEISVSDQLQLALISQMYNNNPDGYNVSIAMALDSISQNLGYSWFEEQTQQVKGKKTRRKNRGRGGRRRKKTRRKRRKSKRKR